MRIRHLCIATLVLSISLLSETRVILANAFEPPPERNAPHSTAGGGSRPATDASCTLDPSSGLKAIALAPQSFIGLTSQATPQIWLYQPTNEAQSIEISVFDQHLNGLTQFAINGADLPSFSAIDLSDHINLAASTPYYWTAAFICSPNRRTEDWVVGGWIKHQPVSTHDQKTVLTPIDQIQHHLDTGYWYDALTEILPLMQTEPVSSDVEETWNSLIHQANLELTWANTINVIHASQP